MKSNLRKLVAEKEQREGRVIEQKEISEMTGLTESTVSKWMSFRSMSMVHAKPAAMLMRWVPCTLDQLITIEEVGAESV